MTYEPSQSSIFLDTCGVSTSVHISHYGVFGKVYTSDFLTFSFRSGIGSGESISEFGLTAYNPWPM